MNLGQMIDPEWVQQRFPERFPARRQDARVAPLTVATYCDGVLKHAQVAPRAVKRTPPPARAAPKPAAQSDAIRRSPKLDELLKVLLKRTAPIGAAEIAAKANGMEISLCCAHLRRLLRLELVERSGAHRSYRYQITLAGRARVERHPPRG